MRKGSFLAYLNINLTFQSYVNCYRFLEESWKATSLMAEHEAVIRGTKSFQVPEYFNFADVIDEWAQKEKVNHDKNLRTFPQSFSI